MAFLRLKNLHPDWTQKKLAVTLARSHNWVSEVFAADSVEKISAADKLDTSIKAAISRAPKRFWADICQAAQEQEWTRDETREKVQAIKAEPECAHEILREVRIEIPEALADKLVPLSEDIRRLCDKLEPELYDWGTGVLAYHILQRLYVLAGKVTRMIEFLEARRQGE